MTDSIGRVKDTLLNEALSERYLSYALSTITARSLPDVRDGLKPVQRRILYAMGESGNTQDKPYRKSASAVGYVMMKYHPHGNDPIYESMVRMAQDFSLRYLMVDGQGNFGSLDGDNAAAMRYTEARLTLASAYMLEGIYEEAVDFQKTYNNETEEPLVLPAKFPNLLANGATGIAVGMATNIPPHNVGEICTALQLLLKDPTTPVSNLLEVMPGPDFPTGGLLVEPSENILKAYETGRGSFRLRSRYEIEPLKGGLYQIVVTEIPYQVQKARLIEKIAELIIEKKIPLLGDVRDESAEDIRLILIPKSRAVDPLILMEALYRQTDLEIRFNMNMNVLAEGRIPKVMNLKEVLQAFLKHRQQVLQRRSKYRLNQIDHRLEVLKGYQIAYLNLDEVIRIIREEDDPKLEMQKRWGLSDIQAEAILNMRLRTLRKLEELEIIKELESLEKEKIDLQELLSTEKHQWHAIAKEIKEIEKAFGATHPFGKRRTTFETAPQITEVPIEAFLEKEPVTIVCSNKDWIRTLKGHQLAHEDIKYKEGDEERFILEGESTDKLLIFASNGRFYTLGVDKLPSGRGHGEALRLLIDLGNEDEILSIFIIKPNTLDQKFLVATSDGKGFIVETQEALAQTKMGKQILILNEGVKAQKCVPLIGDHVAIIGTNRKLLIFPTTEIPQLSRGKGVILQKYKEATLSDLKVFTFAQGLSWAYGSQNRTVTDLRPWLGSRAQTGKLPPFGFPKDNKF